MTTAREKAMKNTENEETSKNDKQDRYLKTNLI